MHTGRSPSLAKRRCAGQRAGECGLPHLPSFALVLSSRGDEAQRSVLVHTMALELNQRGAMQGEEGSKEGQKTSLTHGVTKQSQHNKHDGQRTVVPTQLSEILTPVRME